MSLVVSFQGGDADRGVLEAFAGTESIAGITRALTLISHYVATGEVRRRYPFSSNIDFFLDATEEGSFKWKFIISVAPAVALGLSVNAIYDVSKLVLSKAIGNDSVQVSADVEKLNRDRGGDIEAIVEAVEPALKNGHYGIGNTVNNITIINGNDNQTIVEFDNSSKDYLYETIDGEDQVQDVAISALNVNDRTGRAYFLDLKRTVPFRVSKDAPALVMTTLSRSLDDYANKTPAPIRIVYATKLAVDGRLKRVIIMDAEDVSEAE